MKPESRLLVEEIRIAIAEVRAYVDLNAGYTNYLTNRPMQLMGERLLIAIGDAMARLLKEDPEIAIADKQRIRGLRNRLAHDYLKVDQATVYVILTRDLAVLEAEVNELLRHEGY